MAVASSTVSASTVAAAASAAGFSAALVPVMVAIAMAESSFRPSATHSNSNGSTDYGLWQINSVHTDILSMGSWSDPYVNAKMAKRVYDQQGLSAWSVYNSGAYSQYLSLAQSGDGTSGGTSGGINVASSPISLLPSLGGGSADAGTGTSVTAENNLPDASGVPWFLKNDLVRRAIFWLLALLLIIAGMIIVFRSQVKTVAVKGVSAAASVATGGATKASGTINKAITKTSLQKGK